MQMVGWWWPSLSMEVVGWQVVMVIITGGGRCHAPNTFGTVNMEHTIDLSLSWSE